MLSSIMDPTAKERCKSRSKLIPPFFPFLSTKLELPLVFSPPLFPPLLFSVPSSLNLSFFSSLCYFGLFFVSLLLLFCLLVSRISIVKPEKGKAVEDHLLRMAQSGQLQGKIDEKQLIALLERISDQEKKQETKITVSNLSRLSSLPSLLSHPFLFFFCFSSSTGVMKKRTRTGRKTSFKTEEWNQNKKSTKETRISLLLQIHSS